MSKLLLMLLVVLLSINVLAEREVHLQSRTIEPPQRLPRIAATFSQGEYFVVQFSAIPDDDRKAELEAHGVALLQYVPEYAWIARIEPSAMSWLRSQPWVTLITPYTEEDRGIDELADRLEDRPSSEVIEVQGEFFPEEDGEEILEDLSGEFEIEGSTFTATLTVDEAEQLLSAPEVQWVADVPLERRVFNANARALIDVDILQGEPYNLNGTNVWAAEWDGGWAGNHYALGDRVVIGDNGTCGGGDSGSCAVIQHATHVAGTMLGNGTGDSTNRGMATKARLLSWEWFDDYAEFFAEYNTSINQYNASLSQNSWGYGTTITASNCMGLLGNYYTDNMWVDNASRGSLGRSIPIVWAAGNDRENSASYCGSLGFTYNTTSPMGTAKNVITVGAVDDAGAMSTFSSWGPTDDGRIKPDVVANGVALTSTSPTR